MSPKFLVPKIQTAHDSVLESDSYLPVNSVEKQAEQEK